MNMKGVSHRKNFMDIVLIKNVSKSIQYVLWE